MTKDDFKDDPDFVYFEAPEYEPYEDDVVPTDHMPDIDDVHDVLTTNMLVLWYHFQLVMRSGMGRSCGASVNLMEQ
jgi:hypothetical protein